jgi:dihydropyrimidinase
MSLLIKSGTIITASETFVGDIQVEGERIAAIGTGIEASGSQVIDATGKLVMPGGIDPHTHFDLPMFDTVSSDDHYTGHKAAAFGGTTTVMDFVPQDFPSLQTGVQLWRDKAEAKAAVDYGLHANITNLNAAIEREIPRLLEWGISTLKVFMAYNGRLRCSDGEIFRILRIAREHGMLTMLHAENGDVIDILVTDALAAGHSSAEWHALTRPGWGGVEAVLRGIALAEQAGAPLYIVHVNQAREADQIRYARKQGARVLGETCPPYLFFNVDYLRRPDGAKWVCSPPMRTEEDNHGLWEGLADGTLQTIGTDHCPFFFDGTKPIQYEGELVSIPGKELGSHDFTKIPNGLPGVGDRLPIIWTYGVRAGRLTPNQFVALTSTNAAKIFGLYPRKGALLPGADADIVIWDPERRLRYGVSRARHRTDYNLYEGWELVGFPEIVLLRGQIIVEGDSWRGKPGTGKFLPRSVGAAYL